MYKAIGPARSGIVKSPDRLTRSFLSISAVRDQYGETKNYVAVFHDISEMKTKEKQIEYMAYHDPLTGLPNRILLKDRLEHAMTRARRDEKMLQLIFIDLDNFKDVNDTAGHAQGDELLKEAAERLDHVTRASDTVARLGGDEFIIMVTDVDDMIGNHQPGQTHPGCICNPL